MQTILVDIGKIKPNPKNPRVITDEKFNKLVESLKKFPEMLEKRPLVCFTDVDKKLVVLGGNQRLKAASEAGLKKLPVNLADDWTEEQKQEFVIKDNVGFGVWDWEALEADYDLELLAEWGMDIPIEFDGDIEQFFTDTGEGEKEESFKITLEYNEDDYREITEAFEKLQGSKEKIVYKLLVG